MIDLSNTISILLAGSSKLLKKIAYNTQRLIYTLRCQRVDSWGRGYKPFSRCCIIKNYFAPFSCYSNIVITDNPPMTWIIAVIMNSFDGFRVHLMLNLSLQNARPFSIYYLQCL